MDEMDYVQENSERLLEDALAVQHRRMPKDESATHCQDCEEPIPEARRRAMPGCKRCIDCQTLLEHWRAL